MGGLRVAELFAGVGGFRLGLRAAGHEVVWSNQWEPGKKSQWASECYVRRFGPEGHSNEDIHLVNTKSIPDHDLLVGGFPCQDYSVAATLDKSRGIEGKKGVLWWQIRRILREKRPPYVLLENVDRLLKSPARQRGRDFGIVLATLTRLGYVVEWRVLNAADYGFPQKRRRVFIFAAHDKTRVGQDMAARADEPDRLTRSGFFPTAFPVVEDQVLLRDRRAPAVVLPRMLTRLSDGFSFEFQNSGTAVGARVWTRKTVPRPEAARTLRSVLQEDAPAAYYVSPASLGRWEYLKGPKRELRTAKNGHVYEYAEGGIPKRDLLDSASRTLLTGEGGLGPSRSNHLIDDPRTGKARVLTPVECERLNGFPDGWTEGMPDRWRYFTMGNALVVGLVERMGHELARRVGEAGEGSAGPQVRAKARSRIQVHV